MKNAMPTLWAHSGDHIRSEVSDDMILVRALRATLPPYTGPGLTLYRGDSAWNRGRRTYGLSWSSKRETVRSYASGSLWRSSQGGSVLLQIEAGPEAIICAPCSLADHYGEDEYLVDRRRLGRVTLLERFSEPPP